MRWGHYTYVSYVTGEGEKVRNKTRLVVISVIMYHAITTLCLQHGKHKLVDEIDHHLELDEGVKLCERQRSW